MKKILGLIIILLQIENAVAATCDVMQVISHDTQAQATRKGNGFAFGSQWIILNDHTLAADVKTVEVKRGSQTFEAQVHSRDFHTDLAVLKVTGIELNPCELAQLRSSKLRVRGYDQKDSSLSEVDASVKTATSSKLMVPGILESIEIVASGQSELRSSQSGSVLLESDKVVGLITQKTKEGTALAIPSQNLDQIARLMIKGELPKRKYEIDRRTNTIRVNGLKILPQNGIERRSGVGGVNPHGSKSKDALSSGENSPEPIALEDYDVGAVLALVENSSLLEKTQPGLAKALREAQATRVFISSIDSKKVSNTLDLLRALEDCETCRIDSFWVDIADPSVVKDPTLKVMGWLSALVVELEKNNNQVKIQPVVRHINGLNPLLTARLNASEANKNDIQLKIQIQENWMQIEKRLDSFWHSERVLDILAEIRAELL